MPSSTQPSSAVYLLCLGLQLVELSLCRRIVFMQTRPVLAETDSICWRSSLCSRKLSAASACNTATDCIQVLVLLLETVVLCFDGIVGGAVRPRRKSGRHCRQSVKARMLVAMFDEIKMMS